MCETVMAVSQLDTESHAPENGFVTPETNNKSPGLLSQTDGGVLPSVGGFGKYQKQLIVLTWIPAIFIGFSQFSDSFLLTNPCLEPHNSSQLLTVAPTAVSTVFTGVNTEAASQCNCTPSSYKLQNGLEQNIVTKVSGVIPEL